MNCATHPETAAVAFCRTCGKALCNECRQEWQGVIYCGACAIAQQAAAPQTRAPQPPLPATRAPGSPSPGLAFFLGLIPGVGAIYNGQYAKGILHVVVLGLLISIGSSRAAGELEPLIVMFTVGWFFYMAFEAYHTAKRRAAGEPVDEFSGLFPSSRQSGMVPMGPLVLIALGVVFLLHTLGYWSMDRILRFWPVLMIAAGVYLLYARLAARPSNGAPLARGPENPEGKEKE
ncbi:MAG: hypothetical protein HY238_28325 [Acidobacteria bacterium]|nr:hypothetical protein [Acidobacteriota bacterium]